MRLPNDYDEHSGFTPTLISAIVAVTLFVGIVLAIVLLQNRSESQNRSGQSVVHSTDSSHSSPIDTQDYSLASEGALHPSDLDFWELYPQQSQALPTVESVQPSSDETQEPEETDPSNDGKHTRVQCKDGTEEWVLISPYLPKHEYDFTKLVCQSGLMKYYEDGKKVSYVGVDISKLQDYVDFVKVKKAGIDFAMLRVGARGYGSGQLVADEYFSDNIKRATDAGLGVGVYFSSQAITEEEAVEEAQMVIDSIQGYQLSYPVAFVMEHAENDKARIDDLSKADKTAITAKFLETIMTAGLKPAIYGDKEWLIKEIDMSKLSAYDVWLSQQEDLPDYPYRFTMWQYSTTAEVDGIVGYANLNVSFIDYSEK